MRCYYEVLNVSKDVSDEDLKKSYRKLALKWHPDKNPDNIEEAKREFILVQQAYEVLIDPQERAWYDRHRDSILKGAGSGYQDDSLDIFPYFSVSCFRGYDDSENGFYTIYREVFNKLSSEESEYLDEDDSTPPEFGKSDSSYEEVKKFYGYWSSFCTKKSYTWLNTYDISEAENRRILRLMEQENKKVRDRAKKERNEEIRALVAFVRKRDKRVQQYAEYLKQKTAENNKKAEEHRKKMIAEHRKNIASYKECEWSKFSNFEKELKEIESTMASEFNDQSDESDDDLFCVACNKYFKTEKAFANHEKSKKHKENILILKNSMIEEENEVNGNDSNSDSLDNDQDQVAGDSNGDDLISDIESVEEIPSEEETPNKNNTAKSKKKKKKPPPQRISGDDEEPIDLANIGSSKKQRKKLERNKILQQKQAIPELSSDSEEQIDLANVGSSKKQRKKLEREKVLLQKQTVTEPVSSGDEESVNLTNFGNSKKQRKKLEREKILQQKRTVPESVEETPAEMSNFNKKKDKKKKKVDAERSQPEKQNNLERSAKSVAKSSESSDKNKLTNGHNLQELDRDHECATCNESFDSKNKLFQHLKTSGHSVLLPNKGKISKVKKKK